VRGVWRFYKLLPLGVAHVNLTTDLTGKSHLYRTKRMTRYLSIVSRWLVRSPATLTSAPSCYNGIVSVFDIERFRMMHYSWSIENIQETSAYFRTGPGAELWIGASQKHPQNCRIDLQRSSACPSKIGLPVFAAVWAHRHNHRNERWTI
jgi:hypothetical protein